MLQSPLLFGLLIGAGVMLGAAVAIVARRRRLALRWSLLLLVIGCVGVLFAYNALSFAPLDTGSVTRALLLSLLESPILAIPSIVAMLVVRRALLKRARAPRR